MKQEEIKELMRRHGFSQARQLTIGSAIALCEAPVYGSDPPEADPSAIGDKDLADDVWGYSYGLWQIRSLRADWGTGRPRDGSRLQDPEFNAGSMRLIKNQSNWWPWSTFRNGAFRAYAQDIDEYAPPEGSYIVVSGDSLSKIAVKLGLPSWQELARINGLHDPYMIKIGQILILPKT